MACAGAAARQFSKIPGWTESVSNSVPMPTTEVTAIRITDVGIAIPSSARQSSTRTLYTITSA